MAGDRYAQWVKDIEEQEQPERLSEAFWRADGCIGERKRVRTLSQAFAERRAIHGQVLAAQRTEAARRGRRDSVGEDVASENGGHRLGHGCHRPPSETRSEANHVVEDQLYGEELFAPPPVSARMKVNATRYR
ncbi:hypothetical protein V7S43_010190 [Phytophthora oleae]|uniref:Uncharacterized protein n=1 Tax=Phytophthora oleae TaxID=2107226 RepID=A0ABD3FGN8_9STRA